MPLRSGTITDPGELSVLTFAKKLTATAALDNRKALKPGFQLTGTLGLMHLAATPSVRA